MMSTNVEELLKSEALLQEINVKGWVRTFRSNRFIALNDGSTLKNIQCVIDLHHPCTLLVLQLRLSSSVPKDMDRLPSRIF